MSDRTVIVTGGGTGIGRGIAQAIAHEGAEVVICGRRLEPLEDTQESIRNAGGNCLAVQADVSNADDVRRLVGMTVDAFGTVHTLVNNAGVGGSGFIHEHDIATWDRVLNTNLRGPFLMTRSVLPLMRAQRRGHIINISSESGLAFYEGGGAYGVSKHALNALSEYTQRENQELGIRVDTICPGMVITDLTKKHPALDHEKCLFPEDIADLVIWLLTRRNNVKIGTPVLIQTMQNPWQ